MRTETKVIVLVLLLGYTAYAVGAVAISSLGAGSGSAFGAEQADDLEWELDEADETAPEFERTIQFANTSGESGIDYESSSKEALRATQSMMSDAGVYVTDHDGDGTPDVLLVGGDEPVLFENENGSFTETDSIPSVDGTVRSALVFDYDGDGLDDLLLLRMSDTPVLLENRGGAYDRVDGAFDVELDVPMGAAAADYTGNGCLDVFVVQNGDWRDERPNGLREYNVSDGADNGNRNYLFRGTCSSFETVTDGSIEGTRWSLATSFVDLTGDGRPDIHVANDFNRDIVYYNQGDGTFERVELGDRTNRNGMSSTIADVDGDGHPDIFVTNVWFTDSIQQRLDDTTFRIRGEGNNLLINNGDGTFEERAETYGVDRGGWGWAGVVADLTNDGELDLFHTTRHMTFEFADRRFSDREVTLIHKAYPFFQYPAVWEGTGDGFESVSARSAGFDVTDGRGVAELDANGNGALDLLVANNDGEFYLYENEGATGNAVVLELQRNDTVTANGASVEIIDGDERYHRFVHSNSDYLSQGDQRVHVGVGDADSVTVRVTWPDGTSYRYDDVRTNRTLVTDPSGTLETRP
ncbi:CRTAC1 family protein [Natronoglomus mannanivorans]|uniref:CRTAC1 family protein n=1 Tax=Natronoglomus mannanivorans TaxID=2979990 RepID=A0AAP3E3U5_9EURY|nr:CRTAC1 family protein [Halobacteria archaeon AArc-xg1-1]